MQTRSLSTCTHQNVQVTKYVSLTLTTVRYKRTFCGPFVLICTSLGQQAFGLWGSGWANLNCPAKRKGIANANRLRIILTALYSEHFCFSHLNYLWDRHLLYDSFSFVFMVKKEHEVEECEVVESRWNVRLPFYSPGPGLLRCYFRLGLRACAQ